MDWHTPAETPTPSQLACTLSATAVPQHHVAAELQPAAPHYGSSVALSFCGNLHRSVCKCNAHSFARLRHARVGVCTVVLQLEIQALITALSAVIRYVGR